MLDPLPREPRVGVYALTYNHEDFIAQAIESVLAQGWPPDRLRFVLLDDGSTDATPERVKPYEQHLTYVRQENQGINAAINRLVSLVEADVLVPLSGDDEWPPDRLERVVAYFREHPDVGMVYGDMEAIDAHGRVIAPSMMEATKTAPLQGQIAGRLLKGNFITGGAVAVRGELRDVMLPIPSAAAWEDWWFAWALTNAAPIGYLDAIVYRYRRHDNNFMFGVGARDAELAVDRLDAETPFRRYLLGNVRPGTCTAQQLFEATENLRGALGSLARHGRPVEEELAVTDAQRAAADRLAAGAAAISASSPVLAAFAAARALAADPLHSAAYRALHAVAGSPSTFAPPFFDDVRAVTVFAEAEELVEDPGLLKAYADAVEAPALLKPCAGGAGPEADVPLVAIAREWDGGRLGAELGPVVEQAMGD